MDAFVFHIWAGRRREEVLSLVLLVKTACLFAGNVSDLLSALFPESRSAAGLASRWRRSTDLLWLEWRSEVCRWS